MMKAAFYTRYGPPDVLQVKELDKPVPKANEVLVKVYTSAVNRTDNATIKAIPFAARLVTGLFKPKQPIPGSEFAGIVETVGEEVSQLKVGDRVFGFVDIGLGAQAEYLAVRQEYAVTIPEGISYADAVAGIEGTHYAQNFINKVKLKPGMAVMVYGASGAIGTAAVQLLKAQDITVTAVCGTRNMELIKSIGANKVIDYTRQDFTRDEQKYDCVFDTVGKSSFFKCWRLLKRGGVYVSSDLGFMGQNIFLPMITPLLKPIIGKKTAFPFPADIPASLALLQLLRSEDKFKAIIDKSYSLDDIVEAYHYVEKGHKTGNVLIKIREDI